MSRSTKPTAKPKAKTNASKKSASPKQSEEESAPRNQNPLWFDIRLFTNDRDKTNPSQYNAATYNHINFMIHLLWGVPYHRTNHDLYPDRNIPTIHGPINLMVQAARANIMRDTWPTQFGRAKTTVALQRLQNIAQAARDARPENPTLVQLFTIRALNDAQNANSWWPIIDTCRLYRDYLGAQPSVGNENTPALDLCLPIIDAQEGELVKVRDFLDHGSALENLSMMDLYINPLIKGETKRNAAVMTFKRNGVFRMKRPGTLADAKSKPKKGPGPESKEYGNGYKCNEFGVACIQPAQADCFCSLDSQGNCSAMSGCP